MPRKIPPAKMQSKRIALVGCAKEKRSRAAPARDLYTSRLFVAARQYALTHCQGWFILSAKHGLLRPDQVVEPYDHVLTAGDSLIWGRRVGEQLDQMLPYPQHSNTELVVLAGALYADAIELPNEREFYWSEPLRHLALADRIEWLKQSRWVEAAHG